LVLLFQTTLFYLKQNTEFSVREAGQSVEKVGVAGGRDSHPTLNKKKCELCNEFKITTEFLILFDF
jgi:hypothetical protein